VQPPGHSYYKIIISEIIDSCVFSLSSLNVWLVCMTDKVMYVCVSADDRTRVSCRIIQSIIKELGQRRAAIRRTVAGHYGTHSDNDAAGDVRNYVKKSQQMSLQGG